MADTTLPGVLLDGTHAARPAATAVAPGTLYACSTDSLIYQSDGSAWSTWATLGSGGGGAATLPLDVAPASAHAKDDEFAGSSLDAKWTNPATSTRTTTTTVANGWVTIEPSEAGSASISSKGGVGIRQPAPTGSFTVSAKIADGVGREGYGDGDTRAGIFTGRLSATVKGLIFGRLWNGGGSNLIVATWFSVYSHTADWNTFDGTQTLLDLASTVTGIVWVRLVYDASAATMTYYYSQDGVFYKKLGSRASVEQPEYIGIGLYNNMGGLLADHRVGADWFRVTEP